MAEKANNPFAQLPEPDCSCLLYLRQFILQHSPHITEAWKFNTPFYYYKGRWLCFISYHKTTGVTYISIVNGGKIKHPKLVSEGRKKMKILYVDTQKDVDVKSLRQILDVAIKLFR